MSGTNATRCGRCGSPLAIRSHLNLRGDPLVFAETYTCGAIVVWGHVSGDPNIRPCRRDTDTDTDTGRTP